jgi:hypothetical protein
MMGLHTAGAQYTVTRRAALETGGLTMVSAYLPRVLVAGHAFSLGGARPSYRIKCRLVGWRPAKGLLPQAHGRASPAPSAGAAHGGTGPLPRGRGVRAPEAGWSGQARDDPAITRGGPGPPWGVRVRGCYPRAPFPYVACRGPEP